MSRMKKVLLMCTAYVLVAALAIGGTVAYLQDDDSDVNVMTLGNVSIRQNEEQRVDPSKNGTLTDADIEDFEQNKPIYPYVDEALDGAMKNDYEEITFPDGNTYKLFIGDNAVDKLVSVTNTGKTDAYVRTIIALEAPTDKIDLAVASKKGWSIDGTASSYSIEVKGVKYDLLVCVYNEALKPGETTPYSLLQIVLDRTATNEDAAAYGDSYDVLVLSQAIQTAGFADATTALNTGFSVVDADSAAEWFGGVIYEANTDTWDKTVDKTWFDADAAANATAENPVTFTIDTAEEFAGFVNLANTNSFKNVIVKLDCDIDLGGANWNEGGAIAAYGPAFSGTLDGNGHTIYNLTAQNNWTYANALFRTIGNDVTIKNLTIEGANINNAAASGRNKEYGILVGIVGNGTLTIENVTIRNSSVSCKNAAGILVGGMTEGAIKCKNVVMENCAVSVSSASGKGGAILGDGWSAHDYDYAGIYTDNVKVINCTYTVAGVLQAELPLYNYVK